MRIVGQGAERTATQIPLFTTHCSPELQKHIMLADQAKKSMSSAVSTQQNIVNKILENMIDSELDSLE